MDPSIPFLDLTGINYKNIEHIQVHKYYATETTKALFNIMLNKKRKSLILANFGLTKNIVVCYGTTLKHNHRFQNARRNEENLAVFEFGKVFVYSEDLILRAKDE